MADVFFNYIDGLEKDSHKTLCNQLIVLIDDHLTYTERKVWHGHPVWFIDGNPIVGFSKQKKGIRLMFWSGADFDEITLNVRGDKYKDASVFYESEDEIVHSDVQRWLEKAVDIQWDYKNLIKRKGKLERLN